MTNDDDYRHVTGIGQGCSLAPGATTNGIMLAGGGALALALVARRRQRR